MNLTDEQRESFDKAAKEIIKWLCENCHPHCTIIVTPTGAEITEAVAGLNTNEFLKD